MAILRPTEPIFRRPIRRGQIALGTQSGSLPVTCPIHAFIAVPSFEFDAPVEIAIDGNRLYVMTYFLDLFTFNITSPGSPTLLGSTASVAPTGDGLPDDRSLAIIGGVLFVAAGDDVDTPRIVSLDPSDPSDVVVLGSLPDVDGSDGSDLGGLVKTASGYILKARAREDEVEIIDVSNPAAMSIVGTFSHPDVDDARMVATSGNTGFATRSTSIVAFDITTPASPTYIDTLGGFTDIDDIAALGDTAYVIDNGGSVNDLVAIDISNPASMTEIDRLGLVNPDAITVVGDEVYVTDSADVVRVDASNPATLTDLGIVTVGFTARVAVVGDWVYAADDGFISGTPGVSVIHRSCFAPPV